jgi:hypothetical protein
LAKTLKTSKKMGKRKSWPILNNISQEMFGHDIFGHIISSLDPSIVKGAMGIKVKILTKDCILHVSYMD